MSNTIDIDKKCHADSLGAVHIVLLFVYSVWFDFYVSDSWMTCMAKGFSILVAEMLSARAENSIDTILSLLPFHTIRKNFTDHVWDYEIIKTGATLRHL